MIDTVRRARIAVAGTLALIVIGCGSTAPAKYYTLSALPRPPAATAAGRPHRVVGIGPVTVPDFLDRPQIVTRVGENKLALSEIHRWAGRLKDEFARVLAEDIALTLGSDRVFVFPRATDMEPSHRVEVDVLRFEGEFGKEVVLSARWVLSSEPARETLVARQSLIREPVSSSEYDALVTAQSRAIASLSREIAAAIQNAP